MRYVVQRYENRTPEIEGESMSNGRPMTIEQVEAEYAPVFTVRLLRTLVEQRRIKHYRAGRRLVFRHEDLEAYLESQTVDVA